MAENSDQDSFGECETVEVCITTYKELQPYIEDFVKLLERVFETGRAKGQEDIMAEYLIQLLNTSDSGDNNE